MYPVEESEESREKGACLREAGCPVSIAARSMLPSRLVPFTIRPWAEFLQRTISLQIYVPHILGCRLREGPIPC